MESIAKAYVQIIPTTTGIKDNITTELGGKVGNAGTSAGNLFGKKLVGAIAALGIGAVIANTIKQSISEGAALEQSFGGLDTIYGDASAAAKEFAAQAAAAGISANDYAEQAVAFGASLKQAFAGDTTKAVEAANTAIMDMTDNAAKMGTPIESIQNAYQGFAKQNYTMLDNLKLGYGGTKTEMERLLADAQKISGVKYDISNLGDVYDAIHVIQGELGLTGVAAMEAETTLSGSLNAMQASFANVLGNLALGENIAPSLDALMMTVGNFISNNLIPMASNVISALPGALSTAITTLAPQLIPAGIDMVVNLLDGIAATVPDLLGSMADLVIKIGDTLWANKGKLAQAAFKALLGIVEGMGRVLVAALKKIEDIGRNLITGLWNGISNAKQWVLDKIAGIGSAILSGIKGIFGIHSPSTETAWMGDMLMSGLANGINKNANKAANAMRSAADSTLNAFGTNGLSFGFGGGAFGGGIVGGNSNNVVLNVYGAQGQDVRQLANIVMNEIQSATERRSAVFA